MNNRWRQLAKYLDKEERWEFVYDNKRKPHTCPCCRGELRLDSWNDERGCVETVEMCHSCGYENNWSYGITMLAVGKKWYEEYSYNAPEADAARIQKEFSKQISLCRARFKRQRRQMYA